MEKGLKLPPRLRLVASQVLEQAPMADIGTDHAHLPLHLVRSGRVCRAIAADVAAGPIARARATLRAWPTLPIELRVGHGLEVLRPAEVSTCVLAGMGGPLLRRLVDASPAVLSTLERLVLQPNTDWPGVRAWIAAHGWALLDERIVQDAVHHYLVLVVDPRTCRPTASSIEDLELGPILRHRRDRPWRAWLDAHVQHRTRALERARAALPSSDPRLCALVEEVVRLRNAAIEPS